ncbi:hypothetical protein [Micromonospora sp. NPDC049282]|uniref:hypothetical protein n=1 Tax=Micromonospora sp. NPDC049282 TaxID=3364269 RepID=UPI00371164DC
MSADGLYAVGVRIGVPPGAPPLAWVGGLKGVNQAMLDGGYERAACVDASKILGLALHEHAMKRQDLVIALDSYRLDIHRSSLPDAVGLALGRLHHSLRIFNPPRAPLSHRVDFGYTRMPRGLVRP